MSILMQGAVLLAAVAAAAAAAGDDRYLIVLRDGATRAQHDEVVAACGADAEGLTVGDAFKGVAATLGQEALARVRAQHKEVIESVEEDSETGVDLSDALNNGGKTEFECPVMQEFSLGKTEGSRSDSYGLWGLRRITSETPNVNERAGYRHDPNWGRNVDVYVVDTGVNCDVAELAGRCLPGFHLTGVADSRDENGHGTHVAAIVAGKTFGVAKMATVISVRVYDKTGEGTSLVPVIRGLDWITRDQKTRKGRRAVINMSLNGRQNNALTRAIRSVVMAGIPVVVSASNNFNDACSVSPASSPEAITVGSIDMYDEMAVDSATGSCVDIFAPGVRVLSEHLEGPTHLSGTSQASPHVAGAVAAYLSVRPLATTHEVKSVLLESSLKGLVTGDLWGSNNRILHLSCLPSAPAQPEKWLPQPENCQNVFVNGGAKPSKHGIFSFDGVTPTPYGVGPCWRFGNVCDGNTEITFEHTDTSYNWVRLFAPDGTMFHQANRDTNPPPVNVTTGFMVVMHSESSDDDMKFGFSWKCFANPSPAAPAPKPCNGVAQVMPSEGTLTYPPAAGELASGEDVCWSLESATGIELTFTAFDMEWGKDYLSVDDDSRFTTVLSGTTVPPVAHYAGSVLLHLSTATEGGKGFTVSWKQAVPPAATPVPTVAAPAFPRHPSNCLWQFDTLAREGLLAVPGPWAEGGTYEPQTMECHRITCPETLTISFRHFDVESGFDKLTLHELDGTLLADFSATTLSYAGANKDVMLKFESDLTMEGRGFEMEWTCGAPREVVNPVVQPRTGYNFPKNRVNCNHVFKQALVGESGEIRYPRAGEDPSEDPLFEPVCFYVGCPSPKNLTLQITEFSLNRWDNLLVYNDDNEFVDRVGRWFPVPESQTVTMNGPKNAVIHMFKTGGPSHGFAASWTCTDGPVTGPPKKLVVTEPKEDIPWRSQYRNCRHEFSEKVDAASGDSGVVDISGTDRGMQCWRVKCAGVLTVTSIDVDAAWGTDLSAAFYSLHGGRALQANDFSSPVADRPVIPGGLVLAAEWASGVGAPASVAWSCGALPPVGEQTAAATCDAFNDNAYAAAGTLRHEAVDDEVTCAAVHCLGDVRLRFTNVAVPEFSGISVINKDSKIVKMATGAGDFAAEATGTVSVRIEAQASFDVEYTCSAPVVPPRGSNCNGVWTDVAGAAKKGSIVYPTAAAAWGATDYAAGTEACWRVACDEVLTLSTKHFDLEDGFDFVKVTTHDVAGEEVASWTGAGAKAHVGNGPVEIRFASDATVQRKGFELQWECASSEAPKAVPGDDSNLPAQLPVFEKTADNCNHVFTGGVRSDPAGTVEHAYEANENACWAISCPERLTVQFDVLDIEPRFDSLTAMGTDGAARAFPDGRLVTTDGFLIFNLKSDVNGHGAFKLRYACGAQATLPAVKPDTPAREVVDIPWGKAPGNCFHTVEEHSGLGTHRLDLPSSAGDACFLLRCEKVLTVTSLDSLSIGTLELHTLTGRPLETVFGNARHNLPIVTGGVVVKVAQHAVPHKIEYVCGDLAAVADQPVPFPDVASSKRVCKGQAAKAVTEAAASIAAKAGEHCWEVACPKGSVQLSLANVRVGRFEAVHVTDSAGRVVALAAGAEAAAATGVVVTSAAASVVLGVESDDAGFDLEWRCDEDRPVVEAPVRGTHENCFGRREDNGKGEIAVAGYRNNDNRCWDLACPAGEKVALKIRDLDTEEGFDVLQAFADGAVSGSWSGRHPEDIEWYSEHQAAMLRFSSDFGTTKGGFSLSWRCLAEGETFAPDTVAPTPIPLTLRQKILRILAYYKRTVNRRNFRYLIPHIRRMIARLMNHADTEGERHCRMCRMRRDVYGKRWLEDSCSDCPPPGEDYPAFEEQAVRGAAVLDDGAEYMYTVQVTLVTSATEEELKMTVERDDGDDGGASPQPGIEIEKVEVEVEEGHAEAEARRVPWRTVKLAAGAALILGAFAFFVARAAAARSRSGPAKQLAL